MRFKIDENLHEEIAEAMQARGLDAASVFQEGLQGKPDLRIGEVCRHENRVLVTLDLDFANIKEYPPGDYPGLIVLRVRDQSRPHMLKVVLSLLDHLHKEPVQGSLWIVEEHQIRIRRQEC